MPFLTPLLVSKLAADPPGFEGTYRMHVSIRQLDLRRKRIVVRLLGTDRECCVVADISLIDATRYTGLRTENLLMLCRYEGCIVDGHPLFIALAIRPIAVRADAAEFGLFNMLSSLRGAAAQPSSPIGGVNK